MNRIDRIRKQVVAKVLATDRWLQEVPSPEIGEGSSAGLPRWGRHLLQRTEGRRRVIMDRIFDLSARGLAD